MSLSLLSQRCQWLRCARLSPCPFRRSLYMNASSKQELFSVTTRRWLYNDEQQRAARYIPFNVQAFVDVAIRAAGATKCVNLEKLQEGTFNRVFSLKFDNEVEFVAKIPFPTAGPKHFCTASEVATLDYLRTEHGIPVPNVRAWCSRADETPIGVEYIMYDKVPGVQLYEHDRSKLPLENDPYIDILPVMRRIESRLARTIFSQIGSIYYKADVSEVLRDRPLYEANMLPTSNSSRFCIGPTVHREFWRGGRASLDIDRGPWLDTKSYMLAFGACARASINIQADSEPSTHDTCHHLISDYEKLVPHISPEPSDAPYILWHPGLQASDILVTKAAYPTKLMSIIDWQGAIVAPYYMHMNLPPAFRFDQHPLVDCSSEDGPALTADVDYLDPEQQELADLMYRRAWREKAHEILMRDEDPMLGRVMYDVTGIAWKRMLASPADAITLAMDVGFSIVRHSFLSCRDLWSFSVGVNENGEPLVPFPIDISEAEEARIQEDFALLCRNATMCDDLLAKFGIPIDGDGIVDADSYELAKREAEEAKQAILDGAPSDVEKHRIMEAWPLQDNEMSLPAQLCY